MTSSLPSQPPPMWGERTSLLDKGLHYMFSLNLEFELGQRSLATVGAGHLAAVSSPSTDRGFTFHVQDETIARTGDGLVCSVPRGYVTRANDKIRIGDNGVATLDGRVVLDVEGPLSVAYTGVAKFRGGAAQVLSDALRSGGEGPPRMGGTAFVSLRTECERPKYRWMVENQLFGYGRVGVLPKGGGCTLSFSYDVYAAG